MAIQNYVVLEKRDNHKLLTFLGVFIAFVIVTLFLYILAQKSKSTIYAPIVAVALPFLGAMGANYVAKRSDEKKRDNQDSWSNSEEGLTKIKKSRFSKFRPLGPDLTRFGFILSLISIYLSIYLSEVLNLTKILKKDYPNDSFSGIFMDVATNIFKAEWARKYLIQYWIWVTIFIIILVGTTIWGTKKIEKLRKEEQEQNMRNKENTSKFN
ncbi:hypothetical protein [Fusobacterium canifelinum]|uniref:Uncharacterized protein n=1 Tax=Fusobacterium canifelinum TaxID=285729 RepID=A0A3P1V3S6_9FUSO|nr:hypothetical protein [Fusobacterium canifelinum]RRD28306.1 hypothetical protein EII27_01405 [Fusobacterium canifelinum]